LGRCLGQEEFQALITVPKLRTFQPSAIFKKKKFNGHEQNLKKSNYESSFIPTNLGRGH
jgi:hypothetical protein